MCALYIFVFGFLLLWQNTMTKSNVGRRGFVSFTCPHHGSSWKEVRAGTRGRNPEVGTEAAYWLAPRDLLRLLSYTIQGPLPRHGATYSAVGLEKMKTFSQLWLIPSSPICLCVKLTKTNQHSLKIGSKLITQIGRIYMFVNCNSIVVSTLNTKLRGSVGLALPLTSQVFIPLCVWVREVSKQWHGRAGAEGAAISDHDF